MTLTRRAFVATALGLGTAAALAADQKAWAGIPLPGPTGSDDTASLNAALASLAGKVVAGERGAQYQISGPLIIPSGTHLDMATCRITLLPDSDCNMLQNAAVAGGRDADISIVGGLWDRGANAGDGNDRHCLFLRRVDRLTVRDLRVTSTAGKYAVSIADATAVRVRNLSFDTNSDGVHISGPARDVDVRNLTGRTGDDMMALTARDYATYADTAGDIEGVTVDGLYPDGALAAFKLISGTDTAVRGVSVSRIYGTTTIRPVAIIDDQSGPTTASGITISDMDVQSVNPGDSLVWLRCSGQTRDITFRDVRVRRPMTALQVFLVDQAASIAALTVDGLLLDVSTTDVDVIRLAGTANVAAVRLARVRALNGFKGNGVEVMSGATCPWILVEDYRTVASGKSVVQTNGPVSRIHLRDVYATGQNGVRANSTGPVAVRLSNVDLDGGGTGGYGVEVNGPATVDFDGGSMAVSNTICKAAGASASLDIRGDVRNPRSKPGVGRDGTQPITVRSLTFECDVALLTRTAGSQAYNTNAALSCGVGPVTCDGTTWRHVHSGATY